MLVPLCRGHGGRLDLGDLALPARRTHSDARIQHRQQRQDDEVSYRRERPASMEQQPVGSVGRSARQSNDPYERNGPFGRQARRRASE